MAIVERTAVIHASPGDVWTVLADFAAISRWAANVDHSCLLSDQTEGVGMTRRIQADRATIVETVQALGARLDAVVPDHRTAHRSSGR